MYQPIVLTSIIFCMLQVPAQAASQTYTNVSEVVKKLLTTYGPVDVAVTTYIPSTEQRCTLQGRGVDAIERCKTIPIQIPQTKTEKQILTARNVSIVSNTPVAFGDVKYTKFPDEVLPAFTSYFNCVDAKQNPPADQKNASLSISYTRSVSSTITNGITNTSSKTLGFNWSNTGGFGLDGASVSNTWGITGSITTGEQSTTSTATTTGDSTTISRQDGNTISIPPLTQATLEFYIYKIGIVIPFSTTVTIDAELSPNVKGSAHLSDIIPDVVSRTFTIQGTITTEDGSRGDWLHASKTFKSVVECLAAQKAGGDGAGLTGLAGLKFRPLN
jgi:hypothetical protein